MISQFNDNRYNMSSWLDILCVLVIIYVRLTLHIREMGCCLLQNHVRALREERSLTQAQLGELTGVSRQAINAIETGKYDPSIRLAYTLSKVFKRHIEDIFLFEEGEENDQKK